MSTLRLTLAGAVIMALASGTGGAVVAQEADAPVPVVVTGTEVCTSGMTWAPTDTAVGWQARDYVSDCIDTTSDPRVNGTFRNTFSEDCYTLPDEGDACVMWGTHVLDGAEGGWDCSYAGIDDLWGPNAGHVFVVCPGTGDYAGLTYVFEHVFGDAQDFGDGTDIHGIIYEGPLPAWGPIPILAE